MSFSQTDPYFSNYTQNGSYINPAFAGYKPFFEVGLFYKNYASAFGLNQNAGLLIIDKPLMNQKIGIGGNILYQKAGFSNRFSAIANFANRINFKQSTLSFGMNLGFNQFSNSTSDLLIEDNTDEQLLKVNQNKIVPDIGVGLYYQYSRFFIGISALHLVNKYFKSNFSEIHLPTHFYIIGGYNLKLSEFFSLTPHFLVRYIAKNQHLMDFGLHVKYKELLWFGANLRNPTMLSGQFGLKISDLILTGGFSEVKIGYAFDYNLRKDAIFATSHELFLIMDFSNSVKVNKLKKKKSHVSPLFF